MYSVDNAGNLHFGAGTTHCKPGGSEGGVSSDSISQSGTNQIQPGPDHVFSLLPGGKSQRYCMLMVNPYSSNTPRNN